LAGLNEKDISIIGHKGAVFADQFTNDLLTGEHMTNLGLRILLPIISGYLVYLTLARQLWPFRLPLLTSARPRWMLGCWLGAAVAISAGLVAHFGFGSQQAQFQELLAPVVLVLTTLAAGGLIAWYHYRRKCLDADATFEREVEILEWTDNEGTTHIDYASAAMPVAKEELAVTGQNKAETAKEAGLTDKSRRFVEHARELARQQYNLRCEAEKNLRITRRALLNAESDYQSLNTVDKDKLANLEERLQNQIRQSARAETKLLQEVNKVGELQHKLASAGDLMLQAKSEVRRNLDARARAQEINRGPRTHQQENEKPAGTAPDSEQYHKYLGQVS